MSILDTVSSSGWFLAPSAPARNNSYGIQSNSNPVKEETVEAADEEEIEDEEEEEGPVDEEEPPSRYFLPFRQIIHWFILLDKRIAESSRDVREHRTVFVRNIPFDATQEELSELLSSNRQRRIISCLLVMDRISKHPRGSAFVQFGSSDDAEACLKQSFTLRGQDLQMDMALSRNELTKAKELRDQTKDDYKKHDQRNLALAKQGVILSLAELDGNEGDLRKRQQLEDAKKDKLKNPIYFVSPTRLTIHNLPPNVDDKKLRTLILNTLKKNGVALKDVNINECRLMKSNKESKKSLGKDERRWTSNTFPFLAYGFVNFVRQEHALKIVELLNNNKFVFGPQRRPIVQFAIENRRALQLKEQRRDRVQAKQQMLKDPTKKVLAFETNTKKRKQDRTKAFDPSKSKARLSDLVQPKTEENQEQPDDSLSPVKEKKKTTSNGAALGELPKRPKRPKTKSKGEIRDKLDRMIASTRNKPSLPQRTNTKWFE